MTASSDDQTATALARVLDADWWSRHGVPYEALCWLRENKPVARYEGGRVDPFWLVTRHADVASISKDAEQWLNGPRTVLHNFRGAPKRINSLPQMDGPEHAQHRRAIQNWFSPRRVKHLDERARVIARENIDELSVEKEVDLAHAFAQHPLRMMCEMLGIPQEEENEVLRLAKGLFAANDQDDGGDPERAMTIEEIFAYSRSVVSRCRKNPKDDLISAVLAIEANGVAIDEHGILSHLLVLISAGHDTTASAMSGGFLALIRNPAELTAIRERPELISPAVDEMIRYVTPTTNFVRTAARAIVVSGQMIDAGDDVCLHYAAANRDPRVFSEPDTFKVERRPNPHLSFGIGPHNCVGQMLAKAQMRAVFSELVPRLKTVELIAAPAWTRAFWVSALKTLPARLEITH